MNRKVVLSFAVKSCDGQTLIYQMKDSSQPGIPTGPSFISSHSRDVHSPKDVKPPSVLRCLRSRNRAKNRAGLAMKEITNPPEDTPYKSSYCTEHCSPGHFTQRTGASGRPARWHQHNLLTGEDGSPAGPGNPNRQSRERLLWAARHLETDHFPLHLY